MSSINTINTINTIDSDVAPWYVVWFARLSGLIFRQPWILPHFSQWPSYWVNGLNGLWSLLFKTRLDVARLQTRCDSFHQRVQYYFPHIDVRQLQFGDLLRMPLQILRLMIFQFPSYYSDQHYQSLSFVEQQALDALRKKSAAVAAVAANHGTAGLSNRLQAGFDWLIHLPTRQKDQISRFLLYVSRHPWWLNPIVRFVTVGIAIILTLLCITIPFSFREQLLFLLCLWALALWLREIPGKTVTLILIVLSVLVSSRYIWWRTTATLNWDDLIDLSLGIVLLSAELYAWLILMLGYFQTAWPLQRKPARMPFDQDDWPTVDIFIPTYNEPLNVIRPTVYAALGIDWPKAKVNIVILDDGKRQEFRDFAAKAGVNYLTRNDNAHAKAGNLNQALKVTNGEFVTIFDCDHIPTRSFLQIAMGWFLRDKKLALVQTPHHFFSADPFERNLEKFRDVPNEGELFYGLIQDGNDLWNASFFCGSCAILRREPLMEIGGIAVETVTEDAHTALKLHSLGYNSAYLNLPQAAGLATESLSAHIGQRIRWARGMAQIFRLDNPIFKKGLKIGQRICYSNAMLHFLYGIPRLIFLTAPLAFLVIHAFTIHASALMIAIYVLPHMVHANLTNSRMQGRHRNSFWAEMYETVLAWYILRPTTVALIAPSKGKFNVTAKGGLIDEEYFDWRISVPYLLLIGLNVTGCLFGLWRLAVGPTNELSTVGLNLFWSLYNLFILGGAMAVASEVQQIRIDHRVNFKLPAALMLEDGHMYACRMSDYSEGGIGLELHDGSVVKQGQRVHAILKRGTLEFAFPAKVTHIRGTFVGLRFTELSQQQRVDLVQCTFARADAWTSWQEKRAVDQPLKSLKDVLAMGVRGYMKLFEGMLKFTPQARQKVAKFLTQLSTYMPQTPKLRTEDD